MRPRYATPMAMTRLAILLVAALAGAAQAGPGDRMRGLGGMRGMPPPGMAPPPGMGDPEMPPPGYGRRHMEQDYARDAMRAGETRPLRDIANQWRGDMPGYDFIGSEFDRGSGGYRLKFMREGSVVWVDVDGQGRELRRSGR